MHPICFYLGNRPIYWYGILVAVGFLAGMLNWAWLGKREGKPPGYAGDLGFWLMLSGILGSRAAFVIANWSEFRNNLAATIRIDQGGLIFYGGFAAAAMAAVVFATIKREKILAFLDFAVTALPLGQGFGRIGCFLNGCCYGKIVQPDFPLAVSMAGALRHPVQLYESGLAFLIYAVLLLVYLKPRRNDGETAAMYLVLYPTARFALELLRGDPRLHIVWGLTAAQATSLVMFFAGLVLWVSIKKHRSSVSASHAGKPNKN